METESAWLIRTLEQALKEDDPAPGWYLQDNISKVLNTLPTNSEDRAKIADIWQKMMEKWH